MSLIDFIWYFPILGREGDLISASCSIFSWGVGGLVWEDDLSSMSGELFLVPLLPLHCCVTLNSSFPLREMRGDWSAVPLQSLRALQWWASVWVWDVWPYECWSRSGAPEKGLCGPEVPLNQGHEMPPTEPGDFTLYFFFKTSGHCLLRRNSCLCCPKQREGQSKETK